MCYPIGREVRHMPLSPKRAAANKKWDKANVTRRGTVLPNALNDRMVARAAELGLSVNGYIRKLIETDLEQGTLSAEQPQ